MRHNTKRYKILTLLAQGKSQSWIVKNKSYDETMVCRDTADFLKKKWLICTTPKCYVKYYRATPKAPLLTGEKCQVVCGNHTGVFNRVHNKRWKMDILSEPKRKITWDKNSKMKNGVLKQYLFFPNITIEKIKNSIIIYPHKNFVTDVELKNIDDFLELEMSRVCRWLMKVLQCRCNFPEVIQEMEIASPILNPEIQNVLKSIVIRRIGDCWIDCSKNGFKWGELESTDPAKLKTMQMLQWSDANIPSRVSEMEKNLEKLLNLFDTPSKKDDLVDVA